MPRARLVLITPETFDPDAFAAALEDALAGGDVASLLIATRGFDDAALQAAAETLTPIAQARDVAVMIRGDSRIVGRAKADGQHVEAGPAAVAEAVERAKGRSMVGAGGIKTRHDAMEAADAGADYILFGILDRADDDETHPKTLEWGAWWAEVFQTPCILLAGRVLGSLEAAAETGAEFVALRDAVWTHPEGPRVAVAAANAILDAVAERLPEDA